MEQFLAVLAWWRHVGSGTRAGGGKQFVQDSVFDQVLITW